MNSRNLIQARKESSKLILLQIRSMARDPVIFTGNLNGSQSSEWYREMAHLDIDHIFITSHFALSKWGVLTDTYHGKYPSDHFPALAEISLP